MWKMNTEIIKSNKMLSKHLTYYGEKHFGTLIEANESTIRIMNITLFT